MSDYEPEVADVLTQMGVIPQDDEPTPEAEPAANPEADSPEEAPQEEEQQTDQDPEVSEFLNRYGGDVTAALRAAYHIDSLRGKQANELGEMRQKLEELSSRLPEPQTPAPPPYDEDEWDDRVLENPHEAAAFALQTYGLGSRPYERAMSQWAELDPRSATRFETSVLLHQERQQMQQMYEQTMTPLRQQYTAQQTAAAYHQVGREYGDLDQYAEAMHRIAEQNPEIVAGLSTGTPDSVQRVIRNLYFAAKGEALATGGNPAQQSAQQNADAAKLAATVSTATSSPPDTRLEQQEKSPIELAIEAAIDAENSLHNL